RGKTNHLQYVDRTGASGISLLAIFLFRKRYSGQVTSIRKKPSTTGSITACPRLQKTTKIRTRSAAAAVLSRAPLTFTSRLQQGTFSLWAKGRRNKPRS